LSTTSQETAPEVVTSATTQLRKLNAEVVTTMTTSFLKRLGHKGGLKPKRVSLEGEVYTVEVDTKKFTAVVRVGAETREIIEYDVQPKSEESFFSSFSPKTLLIVFVISAIVNVGLYFGFKMLGL
jgi:ribosomal protein L25 (general stress protein Ctc)